MKKTALVVCPGRGTYNKPELGSISSKIAEDGAKVRDIIHQIDAVRAELDCPTVTELDQMDLYKSRVHQSPDNAAALIYAAGYTDFLAINRDEYDVVAITGNSMGWYTAMACAGCWSVDTSTRLVTNMAQLTAGGAGAQFIYPLVDGNWQPSAEYRARVAEQLAAHQGDLMMSINYGGYAVLAGTTAACEAAIAALPMVDERFPLLLPGHAAFHTSLMSEASEAALERWPPVLFKAPHTPLVDGRGHCWSGHIASAEALHGYTLGHQVTQTYDFTRAIQVAVKEYAPDHIILLGPGSGLGGAVAQALIQCNWQGLDSKESFSARQQRPHPYVLSMGLPEQRALVTGHGSENNK
ncbi:malonyl CoA-ACP transacylase [Pseudidiomarina salinarum]|uniref:[acyl-carrier-protein] S-malonyltransferase n=1 Tax=Pseudidiomarina salinarum TaxID=435908 RepID=A0A094IST3_9GAMM|nr:malonyl CoA-ACP transacylase [Pseudidiomarina salinarum]KFZ30755.1 malonyl CoA-ACP transacylase [Pseudidiomarina salinarum]RUO69278.1 malonyl CoA-ACP transacylase [Pseudidiomarina salinarum]